MTPQERKVMELALEAFENIGQRNSEPATALRQALEQSTEQEPVGVMVSMDVSKGDEPEYRIFGRIYEVQRDGEGFDEVTYLAIEDSRNFNTTQPQEAAPRKPLSDEQVLACLHHVDEDGIGLFAFARAIEAAHGITGEKE